MRIKAYITIEDNTNEEALRFFTTESLRDLYRTMFLTWLNACETPGVKTDVRVEVEDNTKEESDTE